MNCKKLHSFSKQCVPALRFKCGVLNDVINSDCLMSDDRMASESRNGKNEEESDDNATRCESWLPSGGTAPDIHNVRHYVGVNC